VAPLVFGFDWTSVPAVVVYLGALAAAVLAIIALWEKLRPALHPRRPDVMLGHPGAATSHQVDEKTGERRLVWSEPGYFIENKDDRSIYDVTTGVRVRDGGEEYPLDGFKAQIFEGKTRQDVANAGRLPLLDDLPQDPVEAFLFWARFRDGSGRWWEVVYDPVERSTAGRRLRGREMA
jgi:hypothetical protein